MKAVDLTDSVATAFDDSTSASPTHGDIAALAYALWEERGGGDGRADEDWLQAERQLRTRRAIDQAA